MTLSELQLAIRRGRLTASLSAAVAGVGRFGLTPYVAYCEILGEPSPRKQELGEFMLAKAHHLEPLAIEHSARHWGIDWTPNNETKLYEDWLCGTADAFCNKTREGLEVKNVEYGFEHWNLSSDIAQEAVPENYLAQCLTYCLIYGVRRWHISAVVRYDLKTWCYHVADDDVANWETMLREWYDRHIRRRVPPAAESEADCKMMFAKSRKSVITLEHRYADYVRTIQSAREEIKIAEANKDAAELALKLAMRENETAVIEGIPTITIEWNETKRGRIFKLKERLFQNENE